MPLAPGIKLLIHFGTLDIFGFGDGWGGFCEQATGETFLLGTSGGDLVVDDLGNNLLLTAGSISGWMCGMDVDPYECA
jgi:hypothetical protein